jgi:hypothetical protein
VANLEASAREACGFCEVGYEEELELLVEMSARSLDREFKTIRIGQAGAHLSSAASRIPSFAYIHIERHDAYHRRGAENIPRTTRRSYQRFV